MSLTVNQITNFHGFPKATELIEITGTQALEASDRAIYNRMLQIAHDSGKLTEPDAVAETVSRRAIGRGWDEFLRLGASVKHGWYPATEADAEVSRLRP